MSSPGKSAPSSHRRLRLWLLATLAAALVVAGWRILTPPVDDQAVQVDPPLGEAIDPPASAADAAVTLGVARFPRSEESSARLPAETPAPPGVAATPLPDKNLPLAQQMSELLVQAERGEPAAACRLVLDMGYCREQRRSQRFMDQMRSGLGPREHRMGDDLAAAVIVGEEDAAARGASFCAGLPEETLPSMDSILARAMPRMDTRQKVLLALTRPDGTLVRLIRTPQAGSRSGGDNQYVYPQFLAEHALEFLQSGMAAGDPLALEGMILVHAPSRLPDRGLDVFPALPDPYQFAGHALLLQRLAGPAALGTYAGALLQRLLAAMSPEELQRLDRAVEAEALRWRSLASTAKAMPKLGDSERASSLCSD